MLVKSFDGRRVQTTGRQRRLILTLHEPSVWLELVEEFLDDFLHPVQFERGRESLVPVRLVLRHPFAYRSIVAILAQAWPNVTKERPGILQSSPSHAPLLRVAVPRFLKAAEGRPALLFLDEHRRAAKSGIRTVPGHCGAEVLSIWAGAPRGNRPAVRTAVRCLGWDWAVSLVGLRRHGNHVVSLLRSIERVSTAAVL